MSTLKVTRVTSDTVLKILARFKFGDRMVICQFAKFSSSSIFVLIRYVIDDIITEAAYVHVCF